MKRLTLICICLIYMSCLEKKQDEQPQQNNCEWCGANEAPKNLSSYYKIAPDDTPGEKFILSGTVYQSDGKTPASDIIIYAYHTNDKGIYEKKGNETGNGKRHGYLRGWIKTDQSGEYQFETIRPAIYPSRVAAAHVHMTILAPGEKEYWIESTLFKGDPLISLSEQEKSDKLGDDLRFVISLEKDVNGTWIGTRNIKLKN